jgi:hypothetical protein
MIAEVGEHPIAGDLSQQGHGQPVRKEHIDAWSVAPALRDRKTPVVTV